MSTEEEEEKLTGKFRVSKFIEFVVTVVITLIVWNLPSSCFGIEGLTIVQQRVIAVV